MKSLFTIALCLYVLIFQYSCVYHVSIRYGKHTPTPSRTQAQVPYLYPYTQSRDGYGGMMCLCDWGSARINLFRASPAEFVSFSQLVAVSHFTAGCMLNVHQGTMSYEWYLQYINYAVNKFIITRLVFPLAALDSILGHPPPLFPGWVLKSSILFSSRLFFCILEEWAQFSVALEELVTTGAGRGRVGQVFTCPV